MTTHHPEHKKQLKQTTTQINKAITDQNVISCSICQAMYTPAQAHAYLQRAPKMALESAFMSMCHFCFRCRRPSCPNCWDHIHGICADCAIEAHIPFRGQQTPLRGMLFPPIRQAQLTRKHSTTGKLFCIQPGRFQNLAPIDTIETVHIHTVEPAPIHYLPEPRQREHIADIATRPPLPVKPVVQRTRVPERKLRTTSTVNIDQIKTRPAGKKTQKRWLRNIERFFTAISFLTLICIVLLIISASIFLEANTFISKVLHVDIRAEIAYLLQLIKQLF